jgi:transcription initiation factor TFIID subunit 5
MSSAYDPNVFNATQGELKLGPAPLSDSLKEETERILKEEPDDSRDVADNSAQVNGTGDAKERERDGKDEEAKPSGEIPSAASSGLIAPTTVDFLPQPPTFRSVDVKREVEKVRDARKRIKLDPSILFAESGRGANGFVHAGVSASSSKVPVSALPSICAYTFHDALDG